MPVIKTWGIFNGKEKKIPSFSVQGTVSCIHLTIKTRMHIFLKEVSWVRRAGVLEANREAVDHTAPNYWLCGLGQTAGLLTFPHY